LHSSATHPIIMIPTTITKGGDPVSHCLALRTGFIAACVTEVTPR
jgi:hypothetical protein